MTPSWPSWPSRFVSGSRFVRTWIRLQRGRPGNDHDGHDEHDATGRGWPANKLGANIDSVVAVVAVVVRLRKAFRPQVNTPATEYGRGNDDDGHDEHDATDVDGRLNRLDANIDAVVAVVPSWFVSGRRFVRK